MDSDGDLSVTVFDLDTETDAVILGLDRYSDVSEPGSTSTVALLDRAAALASATLSTSAADATATDDLGLPPTLNLIDFDDHHDQITGTQHSVSTEGSVLGAVSSPVGTNPPDLGAAVHPATTTPVLGAAGTVDGGDAVLDAAKSPVPIVDPVPVLTTWSMFPVRGPAPPLGRFPIVSRMVSVLLLQNRLTRVTTALRSSVKPIATKFEIAIRRRCPLAPTFLVPSAASTIREPRFLRWGWRTC